jgi:hypothetical protein
MMVPPRMVVPWVEAGLPFERCQLHVLPHREPTLEAERILMVDFSSTQAQDKEVATPTSREGGQP